MTVMENTIEVTTDYAKFKYLIANRERSRGHIERLVKAFEEYGNLTKVQPILVNDNFEVIDGQHRLEAAKVLGEPIYYTVAPGLGIREARSMNILQKNWRTDDYATSYALGGDASYKRYLKLRELYPQFSHSLLLMACTPEGGRGSFRTFREGDLVLSPDDYAIADGFLAQLDELSDLVKMGAQKEFGYAALKAMRTTGYEQARMAQKLKLLGGNIPRYSSVSDYLRTLEEIYNWKVSEDKKVRLF